MPVGATGAGALGRSRPSRASRDSRAGRSFIGVDSGGRGKRVRAGRIACPAGLSTGKTVATSCQLVSFTDGAPGTTAASPPQAGSLWLRRQSLQHVVGQPVGEQLAPRDIDVQR